MAMGKAFPRRDDAVLYEQFDGTLESAQRMANLAGCQVHVRIPVDKRFQHGDTLRLSRVKLGDILKGLDVDNGSYVVVDKDKVVKVLNGQDFHGIYSTDGI
jgi:hypothetical protein